MEKDSSILLVANIFYNHEHIFQFFNSVYRDNIDYVILENPSKNSPQIEDFFKDKKILKHLRSDENITHGTVDHFFKTDSDLIKKYDYLILTDGDILVYDFDSYLQEAKEILERKEVYVCGIELSSDNLPIKSHPESIHWVPNGPKIDNKYMEVATGTHMLVIKNKYFHLLLEMKNIIDVFFYEKIYKNSGVWARTIINKGKHLTWDYYYPGNEYYEYKRANKWVQGRHNKKSNIRRIK